MKGRNLFKNLIQKGSLVGWGNRIVSGEFVDTTAEGTTSVAVDAVNMFWGNRKTSNCFMMTFPSTALFILHLEESGY